jgi:hypothetical protein
MTGFSFPYKPEYEHNFASVAELNADPLYKGILATVPDRWVTLAPSSSEYLVTTLTRGGLKVVSGHEALERFATVSKTSSVTS